jgi:hypothetical protein
VQEPLYLGVVRGVEQLVKEDQLPRRKAKSEEDEIDELVDSLDELDEEEEEEVEEVEDEDEFEDEEEEDPDEAPKSRRGRKKKTAAKKAAPEKSGVGTAEVAAEAGIEPRQLRMYLRSKGIQPGDDRDGRYNWPSMNSKEVQTILREINKGAVDKLNKEKIADLKGRSKKKTTAKKTTRRKVRTQKK